MQRNTRVLLFVIVVLVVVLYLPKREAEVRNYQNKGRLYEGMPLFLPFLYI